MQQTPFRGKAKLCSDVDVALVVQITAHVDDLLEVRRITLPRRTTGDGFSNIAQESASD